MCTFKLTFYMVPRNGQNQNHDCKEIFPFCSRSLIANLRDMKILDGLPVSHKVIFSVPQV